MLNPSHRPVGIPTPNKNNAITSLVQARLGNGIIFIARLQVGWRRQKVYANPVGDGLDDSSKRSPQTVFDAKKQTMRSKQAFPDKGRLTACSFTASAYAK